MNDEFAFKRGKNQKKINLSIWILVTLSKYMNAGCCPPNIVSFKSFALWKLGIKSRTVLKSEWAGHFGNHNDFYDRCLKIGENVSSFILLTFLLGHPLEESALKTLITYCKKQPSVVIF